MRPVFKYLLGVDRAMVASHKSKNLILLECLMKKYASLDLLNSLFKLRRLALLSFVSYFFVDRIFLLF